MLKNKFLLILLIIPFITLSQEMWINEFHYDNVSSDTGEFVEVVVEDTYVGSLADLEIIFYNGSATSNNVYNSSHVKTLDTFDEGQAQGGFKIYSKLTPGIQQGPDAIALVNNGVVVEFISYEGTMTAVGGPALDMTSVDIGVSESGTTPVGHSLQLSGTASHPEDFSWQSPAVSTMGLVNNGQTLVDEAPKVNTVFPANSSVAVGSTTAIEIEFSETVTVSANSFVVECGAVSQAISFQNVNGLNEFVITPDTSWPLSSNCEVTLVAGFINDIGSLNQELDGDGNGVEGDDFVFSFDIASDDLVTISSTSPENEEALVPQSFTIDLNFTENINIPESAVVLDCNGVISISSGLPGVNVDTVTLTPSTTISEGEVCTVTLDASQITDLDGDNDFLDGDLDGVAGGNYVFSFTIIEPITEIFEIQGSGDVSPFADTFVRLEDNVVTVVSYNGFFMQTPDIRDDNNVDTSNALFVYTDTEPALSVGDWVNVRGLAIEFYEMTEITGVTSYSVSSSGNPLPTVIVFDDTVPSPDPLNPSCLIEFECYEGMLIQIDNGVANTGSQEFSGFDAEAVVTAGGQRAMREPGVERTYINEAISSGDMDYNPDVFDENPELFELDPDALGLPSIEINGGSTFSATGVLAYSFDDYEFWPTSLNFTAREFENINPQFSSEITVATQNMYRMFDDIDDPGIDDYLEDSTTTEIFTSRKIQASNYIRNVMKSPDIIVLVEVENINVVQGIADQINSDVGSLLYSAYLEEGNDFGGIDIGVLTKNSVSNITVTQLGADELLQFGGTNRKLHDRPPLWVNAEVAAGGYSQEINVLGVHMRSRSGITGSDRERIRNKHFEQALSVAQMAQDIQSNPLYSDQPLVILGDFNDFEFSDGYADVVGEIKGVIQENKNLYESDGVTVINPVDPVLTNAIELLPESERYSFIFRGIPQALDHVLLNTVADLLMSDVKYVRGNTDAPEKYIGDYTQTLGLSDHDGLIINFELIDENDLIYRNSFD